MDQTLAPNYKQKRNSNPKRSMIRRSKSISNSGPLLLNPTPHSLHPHYQQPPLLPLPTQHAHHYPLLSELPRARTMSLKPKPGTTMIHHNVESNKRPTHYYSSFSTQSLNLPVASTLSSLSSTTSNNNNNVIGFGNKNNILVGHAMVSSISSPYNNVLSPPPSSLPLPKFCMRSKLSCKAKTGCADVGPTQDLHQVLRLK